MKTVMANLRDVCKMGKSMDLRKDNVNTFRGIPYFLCVDVKENLQPGEKPRDLAKRMYPRLSLKCIGRGIFKNNVRINGKIQRGFSNRMCQRLHLKDERPKEYLFFKKLRKNHE